MKTYKRKIYIFLSLPNTHFLVFLFLNENFKMIFDDLGIRIIHVIR